MRHELKHDPISAPFCLDAPYETPTLQGESPAMLALIENVQRFALASLPTLIKGETGSGKELCARALHDEAPWSDGPFVAVNCASIPRALLTSELFGCTTGAFTGAQNRPGLVGKAHRGTLFLDEVGELSLEAQAALLRVLERREVRAVGSETARAVHFRLVCATHRDLIHMIQQGEFREDLYHRISTLTLQIPPLRERPQDLKLIAHTLSPNVAIRFTHEAWLAMRTHPWFGNVRELKNILLRLEFERPEGPINKHHVSVLMTSSPTPPHPTPPHPSSAHPFPSHPSSAHPFPSHPSSAHPFSAHPSSAYPFPSHPSSAYLFTSQGTLEEIFWLPKHVIQRVNYSKHPPKSLTQPLRDHVSLYVREVLLAHGGNISLTSEVLEISRSTVYKHLNHANTYSETWPPTTQPVDDKPLSTPSSDPLNPPFSDSMNPPSSNPSPSNPLRESLETLDEPLDETLDEPLDETLDEPLDVSLAESLDVSLAKPLDVSLAELLDVSLAEPLDVSLAEPLDVSLAEPLDVSLDESLDVSLAEPLDEHPNSTLTSTLQWREFQLKKVS